VVCLAARTTNSLLNSRSTVLALATVAVDMGAQVQVDTVQVQDTVARSMDRDTNSRLTRRRSYMRTGPPEVGVMEVEAEAEGAAAVASVWEAPLLLVVVHSLVVHYSEKLWAMPAMVVVISVVTVEAISAAIGDSFSLVKAPGFLFQSVMNVLYVQRLSCSSVFKSHPSDDDSVP